MNRITVLIKRRLNVGFTPLFNLSFRHCFCAALPLTSSALLTSYVTANYDGRKPTSNKSGRKHGYTEGGCHRPRGLRTTTSVEVDVKKGASSSDVVTISLNQHANVVEKKVPELERSLGAALSWTVNIIEVSSSNGGTAESRSLRADVRTLVSFFAVDGGQVVSSEDVTKKLQSQSAAVAAELVKVFGEGIHFDVQVKPEGSASNDAAIIALSVLLALSIVGLIVSIVLIVRFKTKKNHQDSDRENFDIDRHAEGYT
ncbi:uncharacterized protein LOC127139590, partial [Lates calcarifer]|uniref:Uncharacterized protein LOC127139590 n=1 Tax=Lates calcarifer TaxID=8187 RepID=A0AAJ8B1J0_LATCA